MIEYQQAQFLECRWVVVERDLTQGFFLITIASFQL